MIRVVLTERLNGRCVAPERAQRVYCTRPLSAGEQAVARRYQLRRYCRPVLSAADRDEFWRVFQPYWDEVVRPFGPTHPFWRNAVSSKMQEWEQSAGELAQTLFTVSTAPQSEPLDLIVVCNGLDEVVVWEAFGARQGWTVEKQFWIPGAVLRRVMQEGLNLVRFGGVLAQAAYHKLTMSGSSRPVPQGPLVLITSSFYHWSFRDGRYQDPYFGTIHADFEQRGQHVVYLNAPLSGAAARQWGKSAAGADVPVHTPHGWMTWPDFATIAWRALCSPPRPAGCFMGCDFSPVLRWHARRFSHAFSVHAALSYAGMRRFCERHRPDRLICNWEGNVAERGLMQAFRESLDKDVLGYCQGVVFLCNLKLRLTPAEPPAKPEPDRYVCTGPHSLHLLSQCGPRDPSRLAAGCALRTLPEVHASSRAERSDLLLIALDGMWGTSALLDWLFENAGLFQGFRVRLRAHPNVPLDGILRRTLHPLPASFQGSDRDLQTDIRDACCVLYRNTSVGMQATRIGVPAIHLAIDVPLPGDPLEGMPAAKWTARNATELADFLRDIARPDRRLTPEERAVADRFARDYFRPPSPEALADFLSSR